MDRWRRIFPVVVLIRLYPHGDCAGIGEVDRVIGRERGMARLEPKFAEVRRCPAPGIRPGINDQIIDTIERERGNAGRNDPQLHRVDGLGGIDGQIGFTEHVVRFRHRHRRNGGVVMRCVVIDHTTHQTDGAIRKGHMPPQGEMYRRRTRHRKPGVRGDDHRLAGNTEHDVEIGAASMRQIIQDCIGWGADGRDPGFFRALETGIGVGVAGADWIAHPGIAAGAVVVGRVEENRARCGCQHEAADGVGAVAVAIERQIE
jgi:hypothetical protein